VALSTAELQRIKFELGHNLLGTGAGFWIGVSQVFENVVATYIQAGASTTATTSVTAATSPTLATIVVASASGISAGSRVHVDVDDRREISTVQSVSGTSVALLLSKAHSGTYTVEVDGGEAIVRELLAQIAKVKAELAGTFGEGALKKVDDVEFYESGGALFGATSKVLMVWRDELAMACGVPNFWREQQASGGRMALY
jgi:hypothetical protein